METLESIIMGLPEKCTIKTPNSYNKQYQAIHLEHTKRAIRATGNTPTEAVVRLAELLALKKGGEDG